MAPFGPILTILAAENGKTTRWALGVHWVSTRCVLGEH